MNTHSIQFVLETFRKHSVHALLMGGQACIHYSGAEFSRDIDFAILCDDGNLTKLCAAMDALEAEVIAVPDFEAAHLLAGLAVHFRCRASGVEGLRVDVMSRMRGVADFSELWQRRVAMSSGSYVMSLPDLVQAKKTQRDKDWPMIRRLLEADYIRHPHPRDETIRFWLRECRTPSLLLAHVARFPHFAKEETRAATIAALANATEDEIHALLREEEDQERALDRAYWQPLKRQLEALRHQS